ncbi:hypothetical protein ABIA24_003374 [Sinorhizobium fredii]
MSLTTGQFEVKRLLNRSIAKIRDMREQTGIRGSNRAKDVVIDLQVAAARADTSSGRFMCHWTAGSKTEMHYAL